MCKNLGTFVAQREKVGLITQACQPTVTGINESSLALRFPGGPRAPSAGGSKQMGRSMSYGILIYRVSPVRNSVIFYFFFYFYVYKNNNIIILIGFSIQFSSFCIIL